MIHPGNEFPEGPPDVPRDPLAAAGYALDLVDRDPRAAEALATNLLKAEATTPGPARLTAQRALGRARYEQGDLAGAAAAMRQGIREHSQGVEAALVAKLRMSLAATLIEMGSTQEALSELDVARHDLHGADLGRLYAQWAFVYNHLGRLVEAVEAAGQGLALLRAGGDRLGELRLLLTRAVSHLNAGALDKAEADLRAAQPIAADLDHALATAVVQHSMGVVHARRGEIPYALRWYEAASATYAAIGRPGRLSAILEIDRAETLIHAALHDEAVEVARRAVRQTEQANNVVNLADARLLLARAQLTAGDFSGAIASADLAQEACRRGGRAALADLAKVIGLEAGVTAGPNEASRPAFISGARALARRLEGQGWGEQALYVDSLVAEWALRWDRRDLLGDELERVQATRHQGRPTSRARAWYVEALARLARGDRRGARRSIMAGLRIIDEHRESLGASELRARSAALAVDLTALGLKLAVESRRRTTIFHWAERSRARALRGPRVRPPDDPELGRRLSEVRRLESELRDADAGTATYRALRAQLGKMEASVRDLSRSAFGSGGGGDELISVGAVQRLLGPRCLVEYLVNDGTLLAAVVTATGLRVVDLGAVTRVEAERDYLAAEVQRVLRRGQAARTAAGGPGSTRFLLDALIVAPLGLPPGAEVIVVPTGPLHGVLWSALPGLGERIFTVAPSATSWARSAHAGPIGANSTVGVILGPDLPGAAKEVNDLVELYPHARTLLGGAATTAAALDLLGQVRVAHVVAHGTYRRDSPLFSSFRLADGSLTVYDLETIDQPPELFVISACQAGAHAVTRGDELLGLANALLASGVRAVVAPGVPIPDLNTPELIRLFYQGVHDGLPVAAALMAARRALWSSSSPGEQMAAWSFVCFG